ncbi:hydrogenase maturation nickel metallochaperone HypA/HybF [Phycisphaera mikurensis]|uniref:Hydrogenase maturation factor HypA n=1 Tax=Phycisphaera mikurensis (strain NBRC 102666 / KCTC 22515 / FYK2301M01) TaxID=1142394 RepID=I0IE05_PHYMF|nr:hydrogenase maturation nickel metallochaperone HypA [Phycisphaera mikurensis]MBB6441300.1 hydrogenase nickel incorporation protein HypA/HybF [Phycisphaera mikurensis]BAM03493.1 hydrogenase nickel incorporation protein HypA [Phycisphaera mikurensis NBRC 102666]
MHELSVAISIVDSLKDVLEEEDGGKVSSVSVAVGAHAGVVIEALRYAWGPATCGTPLEGSVLDVEAVPATVWCGRCASESVLPGVRLSCPACGAATPVLLSGKELDLLSFELERDLPPAEPPLRAFVPSRPS